MGSKSKTQRRAEAKKKAEEAEATGAVDGKSETGPKDTASGGYAAPQVPVVATKEAPEAPKESTETLHQVDPKDVGSSASTSPPQEVDELVGYLEDTPEEDERYMLLRRFFPSKVGGRPAWLIPDRMPTDQHMTCEKCGLPLRFLMQVYASQGDYRPQCFHRTLHFFCCTSCQPSEVRVFRAQLPRKNAFYSSEEPDYDDDTLKDKALEAILKKQPYCTGAGRPAYYFDEHELSVSSTAKDEDEDSDDSEAEDDEETTKIIEELNSGGDVKEVKSEETEITTKEGFEESENKDAQFKRFLLFAKAHQGHVMRYALGGEPFWFAETGQLSSKVPNCENCGAPRTFECQIQPQLISILKSDRLDWGIACCYTCSESCNPPETGCAYLEEWMYVQPEPSDWRCERRGDAEEMLEEDRKAEEEAKFMAEED